MIKVSVCLPVYNEEVLVIKALDSIPTRDDVEIVAIDDCSTDNTYKVLQDYIKEHPDKNIKLLQNEKNEGNGFTLNRCYDNATGTWLVELGADDYFYTDRFSDFIDNQLDENYELVYFDLEDNYKRPFKSTTRKKYVGAVKFFKREWLGDWRPIPYRLGQDLELSGHMWSMNPRMKVTGIILTHWNFPDKVGTLSWQVQHKKIDKHGNPIGGK